MSNSQTTVSDHTNELLGHMYRNVQMGNECLCDVLPKITDRFLMTNVTGQMERYAAYTARTEAELRKRSVEPVKLSAMKKTMAKTGIAVNTILDPGNRHIARMIEKATRMGMDDLERQMVRLNRGGCDCEVLSLCREIIGFERETADSITDYE